MIWHTVLSVYVIIDAMWVMWHTVLTAERISYYRWDVSDVTHKFYL